MASKRARNEVVDLTASPRSSRQQPRPTIFIDDDIDEQILQMEEQAAQQEQLQELPALERAASRIPFIAPEAQLSEQEQLEIQQRTNRIISEREARRQEKDEKKQGSQYAPIEIEDLPTGGAVKELGLRQAPPVVAREAARIEYGIRLDPERVCTNKESKQYPNRWTRKELVRLAMERFNMTKSQINKLETIEDLCKAMNLKYIHIGDEDKREKEEKKYPDVIEIDEDDEEVITLDGKQKKGMSVQQLVKRFAEIVPPSVASKLQYVDTSEMKQDACITDSRTKLYDYQIQAIKNFESTRGLLLIHDVGTGKTLTAIAAAQCFLAKNPNSKVTIITPSSLQENFRGAMEAVYGVSHQDIKDKYRFFTFTTYEMELKKLAQDKKAEDCKNQLLIIDEAHNIRNPKGVKANAIYQCAKASKKVLLLTATPFINNVFDILILMAMINPTLEPLLNLNPKTFTKSVETDAINLDLLQKIFGCQISIHHPTQEYLQAFPRSIIREEYFEMDPNYFQAYKNIENNSLKDANYAFDVYNMFAATEKLQSFYTGVRQAANNLEGINGPKFRYLRQLIASQPQDKYHKFVVYSFWLGAGVKLIQETLESNCIPYALVTGDIDKSLIKNIVARYNTRFDPANPVHQAGMRQYLELCNKVKQQTQRRREIGVLLQQHRDNIVQLDNDAKQRYLGDYHALEDTIQTARNQMSKVMVPVRALIISKSGGEGLDLKETNDIVVMEPIWNEAAIRQVVGRAIRNNSHAALPEAEREVKVHKLYLVKPAEMRVINQIRSSSSSSSSADPQVTADKFQEAKARGLIQETLSVDLYMKFLSQFKQDKIEDLLRKLEGMTIESPYCQNIIQGLGTQGMPRRPPQNVEVVELD